MLILLKVSGFDRTIPKNILDLPDEPVTKIFDSLNLKDLSSLSLTCWKFNKAAWTSYWDRIFSYSDREINPENTHLTTAVSRLEPLFKSKNKQDQLLIEYFFNRLARCCVTTQVNFVSNVFRSIRPRDPSLRDDRFERLLRNLFDHPKSTMLCKLKVHSYAISMLLPVRNELIWRNKKSTFEGCKLSNLPRFSFSIVPHEIVKTMEVSAENTFEEGEIVCVLDTGNFTVGKASLFFGRVSGKVESSWMVYLEHNGRGSFRSLRRRKSEEIGKIPFSNQIRHFIKC